MQPSTLSSSKLNGPDFHVENYGSIFLLRPITPAAHTWVDENIGKDNGFQPYLPTVVIEHRYVADIVESVRATGMVLR